MKQDIEETLAKAIEMGFLTADIDAKLAFFSFIKMKIADMPHHGLVERHIHNSFKRWTQEEVPTNKLAEDVRKYLSWSERVLDITSFNDVKRP